MKVGDLVRVYHFSHTARGHYKRRAESESAHLFYVPDDIDGHEVGLITELLDNGDCAVLIPGPQVTQRYHEERMEVIDASR